MTTYIEKLRQEVNGEILIDEPMKNHTTMRVGGPADVVVIPHEIKDLEKTLEILKESNVSYRVIGRGSNLLVGDHGVRGAIIKISDTLEFMEINGAEVRVGAGYSLIKLATLTSREGLSGLEFASGIPGSVGGAVFMNAGAHRSDVSNVLVKARILFEDGVVEWLSKDEMKFEYRKSILQEERKGICLEAVFKLEKGNKDEIHHLMQRNKDYRKETQPWGYPNCGSVFKNPLPQYAGQLIESLGLKEYRIGGAEVSNQHANFIVNKGDAKASDVLQLIDYIKGKVKDQYAIDLHTEVEIVDEI